MDNNKINANIRRQHHAFVPCFGHIFNNFLVYRGGLDEQRFRANSVDKFLDKGQDAFGKLGLDLKSDFMRDLISNQDWAINKQHFEKEKYQISLHISAILDELDLSSQAGYRR